jgi:catechol 2,3-dioxygenase-like lactoylglutathione lyase family enzyme
VLANATFVGFIPVRDLVAARWFYVDVLGLAPEEESPFALVVDAGGTPLRLTPVGELQAQPFTIAGWEVSDISSEVDRLIASGVRFNRYEGMEQDQRGIWTAPGGDRVAWFADPDGNILSLSSHSPANEP